MNRSTGPVRIAGSIAIIFGALTLVSGGSTLLGAVEMGAVVPFVLWFNTGAGAAYILAGAGLWRGRRWAYPLSIAICGATLLVFAAFGLVVARGDAFEIRTVFAMGLRSLVWVGIVIVAGAVGKRR